MAIEFKDLSEEQLIIIFNGSGSDAFPIKPPQLIFGNAALRHDWDYLFGGEEKDRKIADKRFLINCLYASGDNIFYNVMSYIYYYALRLLGNKSFEYGPKAKTWDDIFQRVKKSRMDAYNIKNLKQSFDIKLKNHIKGL